MSIYGPLDSAHILTFRGAGLESEAGRAKVFIAVFSFWHLNRYIGAESSACRQSKGAATSNDAPSMRDVPSNGGRNPAPFERQCSSTGDGKTGGTNSKTTRAPGAEPQGG